MASVRSLGRRAGDAVAVVQVERQDQRRGAGRLGLAHVGSRCRSASAAVSGSTYSALKTGLPGSRNGADSAHSP